MAWFKKKSKIKKTINKKDDAGKISSTQIKIKVFKNMGGSIDGCRATYNATEMRNDFGELVSMNKDVNHEEDVDFIKDAVFRELQVLLALKSKSPREAKEVLENKILKQERLIFFLNKVPTLNAIFNYQDELAKLRDYRVLLDHLKLDELGSYFYIDMDGMRTYEFVSVDGFYIPIWRGSLSYSSYPDHTIRKKVKIKEDMKFLQEIAGNRMNTRMMNYSMALFIVLLIGIAGLAGGYFYLWKMNNSASYNKAQAMCMNSAAEFQDKYGDLVTNAIDLNNLVITAKREANYTENSKNNIKDLTIK